MDTTTQVMQSVHVMEDEIETPRRAVPGQLAIPCEVYSRVVGYLRPVQNWNRGKQQEFSERRPFRLPDNIANPDTE
jgi:hypothetical protein